MDALNRILSATDNTGHYNVSGITYDKNGNITKLSRNGFQGNTSFTGMDVLSYNYGSTPTNQLQGVTDGGNTNYGFTGSHSGTDYTYDANGNLLSDANKGITGVLYNHLNMPTEIKFNNSNTKKINYTYSADGIKLRKVTNDNSSITTTDYANDFVYENNTLKQVTQPEGYIEPDGSGWQYVYRLTDIWGNTRISFADDNGDGGVGTSEIRREQNYYPGGLEHRGYNTRMYGVKNNLKTYQKQEFTEDLELNTHEWRYRISDPATLRFWQIDPLAEDYAYNSVYAFQENKLGMGIELEGAELIGHEIAQKLILRGYNFINGTSNMVEGSTKIVNNSLSTKKMVNLVAQNNNGDIVINQDFQQILEGSIQAESAIPDKQDARNIADAGEITGDAMVISSPLAGVNAPVVATVGEIVSTVSTLTNIGLDLSEGNVKGATKRAVIETVSGGLSSLAKSSENVDQFAEQFINTNIMFYENVVIPKIEKEINE